MTSADANDRGSIGRLEAEVPTETGSAAEMAFVDQSYTGERAAEAALVHQIEFDSVKGPEVRRRPYYERFQGFTFAAPLGGRVILCLGDERSVPPQ